MDKCDKCKKEISYGGVNLQGEAKTESLCSDCFNDFVANRWGIDKPDSDFEPITLKDIDGISHTFHIKTMLTTGLGMEAIEIEDGEYKDYGYKFGILVHPETDTMEAFKMLYEKMKAGLSRKSIIKREESGYLNDDFSINRDDDTIIGRIEDNYEDNLADELVFSIDGKKYTLDELKKFVSPYVGFNFKLSIYDSSDDIPVEEKVDVNEKLCWLNDIDEE